MILMKDAALARLGFLLCRLEFVTFGATFFDHLILILILPQVSSYLVLATFTDRRASSLLATLSDSQQTKASRGSLRWSYALRQPPDLESHPALRTNPGYLTIKHTLLIAA